MRYPIVRFKTGSQKEIEAFRGFVRDARFDGGQALDMAVFSVAPELQQYFVGTEPKRGAYKATTQFMKSLYEKYHAEIYVDMEHYRQSWEKIAPQYFTLVDQIFDRVQWPRGKYHAFPTFWGMYPRFLEDKTFQVPVRSRNKKYVMVVIAHELLHFMFYDYLFRTRPQLRGQKQELIVWHVSEMFNAVVQTTESFYRLFGILPLDYDEHRIPLRRLRRRYMQVTSENREALLDDLLKEAKGLVS